MRYKAVCYFVCQIYYIGGGVRQMGGNYTVAMAATFHIENFGCRAARADGEAVSSRLHAEGLRASESSAADVVVVNTCSVTAEADRTARAFIRRTRRLNPKAKIVVTGCYAQRAPEELAGLIGVAAVVGNSHKALAPEIILGLLGGAAPDACKELVQIQAATKLARANSELLAPPQVVVWADDRFAHSFLEEAQVVPGAQTRPNLKIQEGCGNRCTFCVIPFRHEAPPKVCPTQWFCARWRALSPSAARNWCSRESISADGDGIFRTLELLADQRWPACCEPSSSRRRCPACASARLSRWTGTRN
jgi:hypothetical protein